ncbi:hypothetical protein [Acidihalobacter ferrooxydans]|nr:hypothetical protein [Acidihalobacter ferrooxydans]
MSDALRLFAAIWFLPLFPFSGVFVYLAGRKLRSAAARGAVFIVWPLLGVSLVGAYVPPWLHAWALFSALLYAVRLLAMRDLRLWSAYLGASAFALLWLPLPEHAPGWLAALGLGIPLALLAQLAAVLEERFGAAYCGLYGGLYLKQPRLAGALTLLTLSAVASPIFPGFFVLTGVALHAGFAYAIGALIVWLLWTWAAVLLLQGFMLGKPQTAPVPSDLSGAELAALGVPAAVFVGAGLFFVTTLLSGG